MKGINKARLEIADFLESLGVDKVHKVDYEEIEKIYQVKEIKEMRVKALSKLETQERENHTLELRIEALERTIKQLQKT